MSAAGFDPSIVQDFLTESGELLEQLDHDLVELEGRPEDPELLNQVFRALHTIKGSAGFLALTNLVVLAHAAESALNAARNGEVRIDRGAMDLLLAGVDTLKQQMDDLREGRALTQADAALVRGLTELGEGGGGGHEHDVEASDGAAGAGDASAERTLDLPPEKADLLSFMVADLEQTLERVQAQVEALSDASRRAEAAGAIGEVVGELTRTAEFFGCEPLEGLTGLLGTAAAALADAGEGQAAALAAELRALTGLVTEEARAMGRGKMIEFPLEELRGRVDAALRGETVATPAPETEMASAVGATDEPEREAATPASAPTQAAAKVDDEKAQGGAGQQGGGGSGAAHADQTIRVEVGRLEALLNLAGELVLQKNRVAALTRQLAAEGVGSQDLREAMAQSSGALERVTSDIQVAVMKTRMQPLDKLFGRYPRLIRDLARKTNKRIRLVIEGGETEVDKSVIEELGDPLIHLLRNSADHGVEPPEERLAAGKAEEGTIRLVASHEGSHVQVLIIDDGRGLRREKIGAKAVQRGLCTEAELAQMSDREVFNYIFAAGFSTAEQVSDLSGRGVGMDVVRSNIEALKGTVELYSEPGKGTTIAIKIPLTVAIMTAMMVGVADEVYAIPLGNILEIVKPGEDVLASIRSAPVMRLRDSVLPLLEAQDLFEVKPERRVDSPFAVVMASGDKRVGLMVSRLIGQQEIVIKPLDGVVAHAGPVSGATVRDDGGVSLIVDVARMVKVAEERAGRTAG